jgi:uncharacterized membrane protein YqgA involved in biofilm formation
LILPVHFHSWDKNGVYILIGTIVNVGGVLLGGVIGLLLKRGIPAHISNSITKAQGVAVLVIGLNGVLTAMLSVDVQTGRLHDSGALLLLISLVIGCAVGELLRIDDHLNSGAEKLERRFGASNLSKGFVTATLIFVVGAMGIVGALNDGLSGDHTVLFTKAMLDFVTAIVLTASLGAGVLLAAIPVLILQGAISLFASLIAPYVSEELIRLFGMVGYALVMMIGFNFLCNAKVKVANMLPALLLPILYYFVSLRVTLPF